MKISFSGIVLGLISVGVGCIFLASTWRAYLEYNRVQSYSGQATGQITKKHSQTKADGGGNYYLDYWFEPVSGNKISATSSISKPQWDALKINDKLQIRYDPSEPNRSIPLYGTSPSLVFAFFMFVLGAVFIVFGISRFLTSIKKQNS